MNPRFRVLAAASLALAVSLSVMSTRLNASTGASTPTAALQATGRVLQRFAPTYMTPSTTYTQSQAVALATEFDLITAHGDQFKPYVAAMKAANPKLVIVGYVHGAFDHSAQGTTYPMTWYAHDSAGNRIESLWFGDWLLDMSNPSWAGTVGTQCSWLIAANGYDGCFVDELGWGVLSTNYLTSMPVDPRTGAVWTNSAWLTAGAAIAAAVGALNPGKVITGNGLDTGGRYYDATAPTSRLLPALSGGMAEVWLRVARSSITQYQPLNLWKQSVDMLADAGRRGGLVLAITKLWTTATAAQQQSWHKYSLASFLLGTDGHSYYSFLADSSAAAITADYAWDHVAVGTALGPYALVNGAYQRSFSKGRAMVNPTTATVSVQLGGSYRDLDGHVVTAVILGPNSGEVVVNMATSVAPQSAVPSSAPSSGPSSATANTAAPTPAHCSELADRLLERPQSRALTSLRQ